MSTGARTFALWLCLLSQALCTTFAFGGGMVLCRTSGGSAAIEAQAPHGGCEHPEPEDRETGEPTAWAAASAGTDCTDVPLGSSLDDERPLPSSDRDLVNALAFLVFLLPALGLGLVLADPAPRVRRRVPNPLLASPQCALLRTVRLLL